MSSVVIRWGPEKGHPTLGLLRSVRSKVAWLVRLFETFRGEIAAVVNHVLVVCRDLVTIVESTMPRTRTGSIYELYDDVPVWGVLVELIGFSEEYHEEIEAKALEYNERIYGVAAIAKQWVDGVLGFIAGRDIYLARRLRLPWVKASVMYNICSWLAVWSHRIKKAGTLVGWTFRIRVRRVRKAWRRGRPKVWRETVVETLTPERAAPDCLWKAIFDVEPWRYIVRAEINPELRPADLEPHYAIKIDHDIDTGKPYGDRPSDLS